VWSEERRLIAAIGRGKKVSSIRVSEKLEMKSLRQ
jgi:hypothetical protein